MPAPKWICGRSGAGTIPKNEEGYFIERQLQLLRRKKYIYMMTLWSCRMISKHLVENKMVIIDPGGVKYPILYVQNITEYRCVEPIIRAKHISHI
jgi:hypothetical protein